MRETQPSLAHDGGSGQDREDLTASLMERSDVCHEIVDGEAGPQPDSNTQALL